MTVPLVREIHDLSVIELADGTHEVSLHLKLPGGMHLDEAHGVAEQVEWAVTSGVHGVERVQTHLEPLAEELVGREANLRPDGVEQVVREVTGRVAREIRFLRTDEGLVLFLTLAVDPTETLAGAHATASRVEAGIREAFPGVADVIVHTEP